MKYSERGAINVLLIPLILAILFLIGAGAFAAWAFNSRQDYKNHTDQKISAAVTVAKQQTQTADAKQFAEEAKQPLKSFVGPQAYGSIVVKYPKTWSAYIDEQNNGGTPIDGYFQPDFVPNISDPNNSFALRLKVVQQSYSQVLNQYSSLTKTGKVTVTPYKPAKVPSITGVRVDGQIQPNKEGSMVILPIRAYTMELWTEAQSYETDFNNNILPNLSFSP